MEECHPCSEKLCVEFEHNGSHLQVVRHGILSKCWAAGIVATQQRAKPVLPQVPFRRVNLTNGDHFDKYDTTGPQVRPSAGGSGHASMPPLPHCCPGGNILETVSLRSQVAASKPDVLCSAPVFFLPLRTCRAGDRACQSMTRAPTALPCRICSFAGAGGSESWV